MKVFTFLLQAMIEEVTVAAVSLIVLAPSAATMQNHGIGPGALIVKKPMLH